MQSWWTLDCGYNYAAAGTDTRQNPVPFTECPAHVELTYETATQHVLRICGLFVHNTACKNTVYSHIPCRLLHPAVFTVALKQLAKGVNLDNIHEKNSQTLGERPFCMRYGRHDAGFFFAFDIFVFFVCFVCNNETKKNRHCACHTACRMASSPKSTSSTTTQSLSYSTHATFWPSLFGEFIL